VQLEICKTTGGQKTEMEMPFARRLLAEIFLLIFIDYLFVYMIGMLNDGYQV
jgi:hypothetical protein